MDEQETLELLLSSGEGNVDELSLRGRLPSELMEKAFWLGNFTPGGHSVTDLNIISGVATFSPQLIPEGIANLLVKSKMWKESRGLVKASGRDWPNSLLKIISICPTEITFTSFIESILEYSREFVYSPDDTPFIFDALSEANAIDKDTFINYIEGWIGYANFVENTPESQLNLILTIDKNKISANLSGWIGQFSVSGTKPKFQIAGTVSNIYYSDNIYQITKDALDELDSLINYNKVKESDLQRFFETNRSFLLLGDYLNLYSQIHLRHCKDILSIPDFLLIPYEFNRPKIIDLKRPQHTIAVGPKRRRRLSSIVLEARTQLLEYSRWFDNPNNQKVAMQKYGCEIYRPDISIVIGRSSNFASQKERRRLESEFPDLELKTYDDILERAKSYRRLIDKES